MRDIANLVINKIKESNNPTGNTIIACVGLFCITTYYIAKDSGINIGNKIFIGKKNN